MIVKAVDIARELGISKATVSLALNNKPGVNENTKKTILECKKRLEQRHLDGAVQETKEIAKAQKIKVIVFDAGMRYLVNSELDLWTDVKAVFDRIGKSYHYEVEITYFYIRTENPEKLYQDCNRSDVAGVIAIGTELTSEDIRIFDGIQKPLVVYDRDAANLRYPCVVADNAGGMWKAVKRLADGGAKDIIYLAKDQMIYNTFRRRKGFMDAMRDLGDAMPEERIVCVGETIEESYQRILAYLESHELPEAFIAESYQMSIGGIRALQEKGIKLPEQVKFIGADELPDYVTMGYRMTAIRIPHTERAKLTMMLLVHEIGDPSSVKSKIFTDCKLVEGQTA